MFFKEIKAISVSQSNISKIFSVNSIISLFSNKEELELTMNEVSLTNNEIKI